VQLEPNPEKRLKYVDFIDIYADLGMNANSTPNFTRKR